MQSARKVSEKLSMSSTLNLMEERATFAWNLWSNRPNCHILFSQWFLKKYIGSSSKTSTQEWWFPSSTLKISYYISSESQMNHPPKSAPMYQSNHWSKEIASSKEPFTGMKNLPQHSNSWLKLIEAFGSMCSNKINNFVACCFEKILGIFWKNGIFSKSRWRLVNF